MFTTFTKMPLNATAYSGQPFSLLDTHAHEDLATVMEIDLVENADRQVREQWQDQQLLNLLKYAQANSTFWRHRLPHSLATRRTLAKLPVQSRNDVMKQVQSEGSLLKAEHRGKDETYASSGSTGTPVKVHLGSFNSRFNAMRSHAQFFMAGWPINETLTFIKPAGADLMLHPHDKLRVKRQKAWTGNLSQVFANGPYKFIEFARDETALLEELQKDRVGYLSCPSSFMHLILRKAGVEQLHRMGLSLWLHHSDDLDASLANDLRQAGIPTMSNYSCSEAGLIATECTAAPGHYHVAHSNVIVECDKSETVLVDGAELGRILITHLHSYATPLIRYDVGDFGRLDQVCPCGHDGPTLSHLHGRGKFFLRHPEGHLMPFYVFSARLLEVVTFSEFRVHQPDLATIIVEIGGREAISADEEERLKAFIIRASDPAFRVEVKVSPAIDWSRNPKRLAFTSAVA